MKNTSLLEKTQSFKIELLVSLMDHKNEEVMTNVSEKSSDIQSSKKSQIVQSAVIPSTSGKSNVSSISVIKSAQSSGAKKKLFTTTSTTPNQSSNNTMQPQSTTELKTNKYQTSSKKKVTPKKSMSPTKSPAKSSVNSMKSEEEDDELNFKSLDYMKEIFQNCLQHSHQRKLLTATEIEFVVKFIEMDVHYQYFLLKLFLYLPKWYNVIKFCKKIKLDQKMDTKKLSKMYEEFKEKKYIDADVTGLGTDELLNMLSAPELKEVCKMFKLGKHKCNIKKEIIETLKKNARTQSTLFTKKSGEDVLKEAVYKCLGFSVKLKDNIRKTLYKAYLLETFVKSAYNDPQEYLSDMNYRNVLYPAYSIESCRLFSSREQFARYHQAISLKKEYYDAVEKKANITMKQYCDTAFEELQNISSEGKWDRDNPDYLHSFSAEYQYIAILKTSSKTLIKYHESVKIWLEFLIKNYPLHYAAGFWYKQLAHILVHYVKDYEMGARIVIEAFQLNERENKFNLVQIYELSSLAYKIMNTKSYKVCTLYCDKLAKLAEMPVKSDHFPKKTITGQLDRSRKVGRKTYSFIDENNEENFGKVEMIVLNHYEKEENYKGIHCEGTLVSILFTLLFWDIIYECYVPDTFVSKYQHAPLDIYSDSFYKNRQEQVDERLEDIAKNWSPERMEKHLRRNWDNHSHEASITNCSSITEFTELLERFQCIDRNVLSKIFKRLVTNYKRFRSGLPDLFLWNTETSKCKFVEVKGEGDKLSLTQMLWIQYLIDIGADVEVCHVSGVGAKKLKAPKAKEDEADS